MNNHFNFEPVVVTCKKVNGGLNTLAMYVQPALTAARVTIYKVAGKSHAMGVAGACLQTVQGEHVRLSHC